MNLSCLFGHSWEVKEGNIITVDNYPRTYSMNKIETKTCLCCNKVKLKFLELSFQASYDNDFIEKMNENNIKEFKFLRSKDTELLLQTMKKYTFDSYKRYNKYVNETEDLFYGNLTISTGNC